MTTTRPASTRPATTSPTAASLRTLSTPTGALATADTASAGARPELPTLPALVTGKVTHQRRGTVRHSFRYGVYQWLVDLDKLPGQPWYLRPFTGFRAADHLGDPARPIKDNVEHFLSRNGITLRGQGRIIMLANARVLGHVFDPLSVFWCFDDGGELACIVAEVHNTYGERHAYLLRPGPDGVATTDKEFHVSPFYDVSGRYELRFELSPRVVSSTVILRREGTVAFTATFRGHPAPATRTAVTRQLLRKPLMPQQVSAMIRVHGVFLWLRRLPVLRRPHHQPQEGV